ncbi:TetR/AcrR family transcriptional regulator [Pseudoalteromonas phenolica]|uniref:TetR/AcrR family transcriptional regulator n=1 Tax=Pseudoalteromonas phenolica TaxID=161398 RepID=UPI00127F07A3|nr:TetR/AcrR family transcriptional regulator [Pseudoalteromonas phenolica]TMO53887.1 transcriptional regulator [Pseudoalteromonas phenolica]
MSSKGERTRNEILKQSIMYISQFGLADVTIGSVAKLCDLSRTGVISHFKNKEDMQIAILEYGETLFIERVITPARCQDPLEHLLKLLDCWSSWINDMFNDAKMSCPFIKAIVEFQNRPDSEVRSFIINQQERLLGYLTHRIERCIEHKLLSPSISSSVIAYELYSLYLGHAITKYTLSEHKAGELFKQSVLRLVEQYRA